MKSALLFPLLYFGIAHGIAPHHLIAIIFNRLSGLRTVPVRSDITITFVDRVAV
jgi:hypothetical protein